MFDYALDLRYQVLQPDLFHHAFPICLRFWQHQLETGDDRTVGLVQQIHASLAGNPQWKSLLDERMERSVDKFLRYSLLDVLDVQQSLHVEGYRDREGIVHPSYRWTSFLASYGTFASNVDILWAQWWSFESAGAAISALQYAACLIYSKGDDPVFKRKGSRGGGPPCLWSYESVGFEEHWLRENVDFLEKTLTVEYLRKKLKAAVDRLEGGPEHDRAAIILDDLNGRLSTVEARIKILSERLATPSSPGSTSDW